MHAQAGYSQTMASNLGQGTKAKDACYVRSLYAQARWSETMATNLDNT